MAILLGNKDYNPYHNTISITIPQHTVVNVKTLELAFAAMAQKVSACETLTKGTKLTLILDIKVDECDSPTWTYPCETCKTPVDAGKTPLVELIEIRPSVSFDGKEPLHKSDNKWNKAFEGNSLVFDKKISKHILKNGEDISAGQEIIIIKPKY